MTTRNGLVAKWIALTLVASIVAAVDGGWVARWTALAPSRVWHGELWRLVTWPFVETGPVQLVLTCAAIYKLGGELVVRWGERRLRRFVLEIVIAAGVATCVLAAFARGSSVWRLGGWAMVDTLVIAWARQFPNAVLALYGLVPLRGRRLVQVTIAIAVVFAIFLGPVTMAPELAACAAAALYPRGLLYR